MDTTAELVRSVDWLTRSAARDLRSAAASLLELRDQPGVHRVSTDHRRKALLDLAAEVETTAAAASQAA